MRSASSADSIWVYSMYEATVTLTSDFLILLRGLIDGFTVVQLTFASANPLKLS